MDRRTYLGLGAGLTAGLAGCTANALPRSALGGEPTPPQTCPAVGDFERTVCPADDGPVAVTLSSRTVSGETWSLVVGLLNRTEQGLVITPSGWSLFRRSQEGWTTVVPAARVQESRSLAPGDRYEWQLTAGSEALSDPDRRIYLDLPAGEYAFVLPVGTDSRSAAVAPFSVQR
ncbi:MAG: hypothetical protein ABEH59_00945 [Halobacteriales archaeon]